MSDLITVPMIVVDLETSGINPERHEATEIAWWNLATGERGEFIPAHNPHQLLAAADIRALEVSRYIERGLARTERHDHGGQLLRLWEQFGGPLVYDGEPGDRPTFPGYDAPKRIFAAVNPAFDSRFLSKAFGRLPDDYDLETEPWDYHLRDLGSYAAGVLGLPLDRPPLGFRDICERLDVPPGDHTAAGDVTATGECFLRLARIASVNDFPFTVVPCTGRCDPDARTDGECDCPLNDTKETV